MEGKGERREKRGEREGEGRRGAGGGEERGERRGQTNYVHIYYSDTKFFSH